MNKEAKALLPKIILVAGIIVVGALALYYFVPFTTPQTDNNVQSNVIAKVGDINITEQDFEFAEIDLQKQFAQVPAEFRKAAILNALIDIQALAEAAEEAGFDEADEFKARVKFLRARALHNAYFKQMAVDKVDDDAIKARYEEEIAQTVPEKEVDARHILVKTEEEAIALIAELDAGKDFAELAKASSIGPSGANGGTLGYFTKEKMVSEFANAAFALETGTYTKSPVKTQFGWHIILKQDQRNTQPPSLEDSKVGIRQILLREKYLALIDASRDKFKVEILDEKLKAGLEKLNAAQ
jgi:peptidyl-prolyl cis-trans isomerase C